MVWQSVKHYLNRVVAHKMGVILTLGLTTIAPYSALAAPVNPLTMPHVDSPVAEIRHSTPSTLLSLQSQVTISPVLNNNPVAQDSVQTPAQTYLYGTSPQSQQLGHEYMVLQVNGQQVQGVFYQINSEYACFQGEINQGKLDLAVTDPYEQVAYNYQLNYAPVGYVANSDDRPVADYVPEGFHSISRLSDLDRQLLDNCRPQGAKKASVVQV